MEWIAEEETHVKMFSTNDYVWFGSETSTDVRIQFIIECSELVVINYVLTKLLFCFSGEFLQINVHVSYTDLCTNALSELRRIITDREFIMGSSYVAYAEIHPLGLNDTSFNHIASYLAEKKSVIRYIFYMVD